jgi:hypothetical protein
MQEQVIILKLGLDYSFIPFFLPIFIIIAFILLNIYSDKNNKE